MDIYSRLVPLNSMRPHVGAEVECHSFLASALDVSGYLHALVALSLSKQSLVPINKMVGGPLDRSGHLGEETDL